MEEHKNIWCVAEVQHGEILPSFYDLAGAGRALADSSGEKLCAVLLGPGVSEKAKDLGSYGLDKVYVLEDPLLEKFLDEVHSRALAELILKEKPSLVLLSSSGLGHSLASRTAVLVHSPLATDVTELSREGGRLKASRPCCGASMKVALEGRQAKPEMLALRPGAFPKAEKKEGRSAEIVPVPLDSKGWKIRSRFKESRKEEEGEKDIAQSDIVVSGGYGLGKPEGFELIRDLAKSLGGVVGASRRAVDLGWIAYRHQVGLTGRTVNPKLYVACGISGQVQHLAGMSSARVIVAVNKDPEAPLMKMATFAVETDVYEFLPVLIREIKKAKNLA